MKFFANSIYLHSNIKDRSSDCYVYETFKAISPSIKTMVQKFTFVVFEEVKWEERENSTLKIILQLFVDQDFKLDVTYKIHFRNKEFASRKKATD